MFFFWYVHLQFSLKLWTLLVIGEGEVSHKIFAIVSHVYIYIYHILVTLLMKIFYWHGYGWTWIVQPDIKAIKKRIEDLITRDYLERDKENPNMFKYLAWFECWSQEFYLGYAGSTGTWIRNLGFCCIWYATLKILGFWKEWIIFVQCAIKASFVQFTIFSREFNGNWFLKSLCTAIRLFLWLVRI